MAFWFVAVGALAGLVLGTVDRVAPAVFFGAVAGWLWFRQRALARRLAALEAREEEQAGGRAAAPAWGPPPSPSWAGQG